MSNEAKPTLSRQVQVPEDIENVFSLKNATAIVTGAGSGLGRAIAIGLASFGARVVVTDREGRLAEETTHEVQARHGVAHAFTLDVTKIDQAEAVYAALQGQNLLPDILFNVAGVNNRKYVSELSIEEYLQVLHTNLLGTFICSKVFMRGMVQQRRGKIVNMSSIFGQAGMEKQAAYSSSKGGINQLTKVLAVELAPYNIQVNALAPAHHKTPLVQQIVNDSEWFNEILRHIPQHRLAEPWEIIGPAVFLASRASSFITGIILPVDGGWLIT